MLSVYACIRSAELVLLALVAMPFVNASQRRLNIAVATDRLLHSKSDLAVVHCNTIIKVVVAYHKTTKLLKERFHNLLIM